MLDNLPSATDQGPDFRIEVNPRFRESLVSAIKLYSEARSQALNTLYQGLKAVPAASRSRGEEWAADVEEIAGCCGYFSFCLQDFAQVRLWLVSWVGELLKLISILQEMITFLDILEEMEDCQHHTARSWTWLKFWRYFGLGKSEYDQGESMNMSPSHISIWILLTFSM